MSFQICASGFGEDWDGTYELLMGDQYEKIPERNYWVYRDSWYWFISASPYKYDVPNRKAEKIYPGIEDPTGNYNGIDGNPNGSIAFGHC